MEIYRSSVKHLDLRDCPIIVEDGDTSYEITGLIKDDEDVWIPVILSFKIDP